MDKAKNHIREYDVLRVFAILLVVLGHSDFLASHEFTVTTAISDTLPAFQLDYLTIRPWIYSFHMPLFMLLSGAMFSLSYKKYAPTEYIKNVLSGLWFRILQVAYFFRFQSS